MKSVIRFCFFLMILMNVFPVFGQSVSINPISTSFSLATTAQLENSNIVSSSFSISVSSLGKAYTLKAAISARSNGSTGFAAAPFTLALRNISGVNTNGAVNGAIYLSDAPSYATLGTNATRTNNNTATWLYDLTLLPVGYLVAPGTYSFTITVQYTDGVNTLNRSFTVTVVIQAAVSLQLTQNAAAQLNFNTPGDYQNGITLNNLNNIKVKSNTGWLFTANTATPQFTISGSDATPMPASVLSLKAGTQSFVLSPVAQSLNSGNSTAGSSFTLSLLGNPSYNYGPGLYTIVIYYTVTAQ